MEDVAADLSVSLIDDSLDAMLAELEAGNAATAAAVTEWLCRQRDDDIAELIDALKACDAWLLETMLRGEGDDSGE